MRVWVWCLLQFGGNLRIKIKKDNEKGNPTVNREEAKEVIKLFW